MLEKFKKLLGTNADAKDDTSEKLADTAALQAELNDVNKQLEFLVAKFGNPEGMPSYDEVVAALTDITTKFETANAALAEVEQARASAVAEAHAAKMAARKAVVVATIGDAKADAFVAATEMLDDTAFEAVSSALAGSAAAEADTPLFNDVGVEAQADTTKVVEESAEMKLLKQKYGAK